MEGIDADHEGVARAFLLGGRLGECGDVVDCPGGVAGEIGDVLRYAVFEDAEIGRAKSADVVTFLIGDDDGDEDLLNVEADDGVLG